MDATTTTMQRWILASATGFGLGRAPVASGTFGALLGLPLALALTTLHGHLAWQIGICLLLTLLAVPMGIVGLISLIRSCLHDHEMSIGAASRLEFLEELVYLERLTLERKERFGRPWQTGEMAGEVKIYEGPRRKVAA